MANANTPYGLKAIRRTDNTSPEVNTRGDYSIASAYSTSIFRGDLVKSSGTSSATRGRRGIVRAAAGDTVVGVFDGVSYIDSTGKPTYAPMWTASVVGTDIHANVFDDPETLFHVQCDGVGLAAADIASCADIVATAGNTATGVSAEVLGASTIGATATLSIVGLAQLVGNDFGTYAKALVQIQEHEYRYNALTVV